MITDVLSYAKERSPIAFTMALSFFLFISGVRDLNPPVSILLLGWISMITFLFLIRLSDDICDIPIDSITHPARGLCSGKLSLGKLNRFRALAVALLLTAQTGNPYAFAFLLASVIFFCIFFIYKPVLPTLVHVTLLNFSLFVFPVYCGLLIYSEFTVFHLLMGVFFWLGGLAHDFSHSVIDTTDRMQESLNPINRLDQSKMAWLSLVLFLASAAIGLALLKLAWPAYGFAVCLGISILIVLVLEYRLIRAPSEKTAKPFYIFGFLFFLLPVAGQLYDLFAAAY